MLWNARTRCYEVLWPIICVSASCSCSLPPRPDFPLQDPDEHTASRVGKETDLDPNACPPALPPSSHPAALETKRCEEQERAEQVICCPRPRSRSAPWQASDNVGQRHVVRLSDSPRLARGRGEVKPSGDSAMPERPLHRPDAAIEQYLVSVVLPVSCPPNAYQRGGTEATSLHLSTRPHGRHTNASQPERHNEIAAYH